MAQLHRFVKTVLAVAGAVGLCTALPAQAVNWGEVRGKDIILLAPGQASWEWVLTGSDHSAAKSVRKGTKCRECHEGEEKKIGELMDSGKKMEPAPIKGRPGFITVNVKAAHEKDRLYVRLEWAGVPQPSGTQMDPDYPSKVALMFSDGRVKESRIAGCWGACHDDAANMASASQGKEITKYLFASRTKVTRRGGGENYKSAAALADLMKKGVFLEFWRAKLKPGKPAVASDGYVLDKRHENKTSAVSAESGFKNGKWVVVLSRKLTPSGKGRISFAPGKLYHIGLAVHDDYFEGRFHYVSFEYTLALGKGKADIVAIRQ